MYSLHSTIVNMRMTMALVFKKSVLHLEMWNERHSPVLKIDLLSTHPSTLTSFVHRLCCCMITSRDSLLCFHHNYIGHCRASVTCMNDAVVFPGRILSMHVKVDVHPHDTCLSCAYVAVSVYFTYWALLVKLHGLQFLCQYFFSTRPAL